MQIASGSLDPVVALLVFRRRIGCIAEQFESCDICRQDIIMAETFDQYMIDAKHARLSWVGKRRWQALKMYAKFQWSILHGAWFWAIKPSMKDAFNRLHRIHFGEEADESK